MWVEVAMPIEHEGEVFRGEDPQVGLLQVLEEPRCAKPGLLEVATKGRGWLPLWTFLVKRRGPLGRYRSFCWSRGRIRLLLPHSGPILSISESAQSPKTGSLASMTRTLRASATSSSARCRAAASAASFARSNVERVPSAARSATLPF